MPRTRMEALWEAPIPLPPLDEQRRIVARVEELLERVREAKRLRAAALQEAEQLMFATLAEVLPDPQGELPSGWIHKELAEISEKPQYGYTQSAKAEQVGPKFLRITDIQKGEVNWDTVPYCECAASVVGKYRLRNGDILFARSGATTGKTYLVKDCPEAVFASYLIRLRLKPGVLPDYVYWFFQSHYYWEQIKPRGGAQPNMNAQILGRLHISLPSSEVDQRSLVNYLNEVWQQITALRRAKENSLTELSRLEQAILDRAFRGEL